MPPPFRTDTVRIRDTPHTLHVAHYGTPTGTPAIFLHGGPGSCIDDGCADAFDHGNWHVVAFDQRGCGRSTPRDALEENTPQAAVEDVERLRKRYFKQQNIVLVGGSYGSLLALLYATKYAKHLRAFVVRGVYFGGPILHPAAQRANTRAWRTLQRRTRRKTLRGITDYTAKRLADRRDPALARAWCRVEEAGLVSDPRDLKGTPWADPSDADRHTCALLEAYFKAHRFWLDDGPEALLKGATRELLRARVPGVILHGEDDAICPVANARRLHAALDDGSGRVALDVVKGAAHSALDRKNARALREAVRRVHAGIVNGRWEPCVKKHRLSHIPSTERATFGTGCFWGAELFFQRLPGVHTTRVGYMGGSLAHPTYQQVCTGTTGHAEVVDLQFHPAVVSYKALLNSFWAWHDPTTLNRQGNDRGTQYRSVIFYYGPQQRAQARAAIAAETKRRGVPVTTQLVDGRAHRLYEAEDEHQRYLEKGGQDASKGATTPISCYGN